MKPDRIALIVKIILTVIMLSWYVFLPVTGYETFNLHRSPFTVQPSTFTVHLFYLFSHANIWHLLGNLFVLWIMRPPLHIIPAVAIAVMCSFLPAWGLWPIGMTVGFSGVLFAICGMHWGRYCRRAPSRGVAYYEFCTRILPFALIGIILPHVNWCLHLHCLLAGLFYARFTPPHPFRFNIHLS